MAKYHISSSGAPAPCHATVKACPLGGENEHFESKEQAFEYIENKAKFEKDAQKRVSDYLNKDQIKDLEGALIALAENANVKALKPYIDVLKSNPDSNSDSPENDFFYSVTPVYESIPAKDDIINHIKPSSGFFITFKI